LTHGQTPAAAPENNWTGVGKAGSGQLMPEKRVVRP
jgi:hypothetical protein